MYPAVPLNWVNLFQIQTISTFVQPQVCKPELAHVPGTSYSLWIWFGFFTYGNVSISSSVAKGRQSISHNLQTSKIIVQIKNMCIFVGAGAVKGNDANVSRTELHKQKLSRQT